MIIEISNIGGLAFLIAFVAGLLSFLSPCVLPLVPAYIGYLSGATVASGGEMVAPKRTTFSHAVAFVLGFSILFVFIGALVGAAQLLLGLFTANATEAAFLFQKILTDLLTSVGAVLLVIIAVRVADSALGGAWRLKVGGSTIVWPSRSGGIAQSYVRWGLVGLLSALVYLWVSPAQAPVVRAINVVLLVILTMCGAQPSARAAAVLGALAAAVNTVGVLLNPVSKLFTPAEWVGVLVQAVLIFLVVYVVSRTTLFYQERRIEVSSRLRNRGYLTSGVMGAVFGAGWTPCTGPNLAIILGLAGNAGSVGIGGALLATYALGLGIPFLLVGLMFGTAIGLLRRVMPYMGWIKAVNTALLLAVAVLVLSGSMQSLANTGQLIDEDSVLKAILHLIGVGR
jgi:cytochrome c biogenesis protein CcdA